jgi:hypothetical protein
VEAIQQAESTEHIEQIIQMARADEPRPRASAINALLELRTPEAMASLSGMLTHPDAEFRTSALWLVDHLGLIAVARQVAEMSLDDPSQQVRSQAHDVVQRLIDRMSEPEPAGDHATDAAPHQPATAYAEPSKAKARDPESASVRQEPAS